MHGESSSMASVKMSRLSPFNITDELIRARLYGDIQDAQPGWDLWEVSLDEVRMPELISLRYYGTQQLKVVVATAAGLDDMRDELEPGTAICLPPLRWVRERIRHYMKVEQS